jgi:hypothetical protein
MLKADLSEETSFYMEKKNIGLNSWGHWQANQAVCFLLSSSLISRRSIFPTLDLGSISLNSM